MSKCLIALSLFVAFGCQSTYGGPVTAAPPGPVDMVRSIWGDYSGRCPNTYAYCSAGGQAICCPTGARCEQDSGGAYCVPRAGQPAVAVYSGTGQSPCPPD